MRYFLVLIAVWTSSTVQTSAQAIRLQNMTAYDVQDKRLYIGIDNKLRMQPPRSVDSVYGEGCQARIAGDTIFVTVQTEGPATVVGRTKAGLLRFEYEAVPLPALRLYLEGHAPGTIFLSRFIYGQKLMIETNGKDFWSKVKVIRFAAAINNQPVINAGTAPNSVLTDAIKRAPPGSQLVITAVELEHKYTHRRRMFTTNQVIIIQ